MEWAECETVHTIEIIKMMSNTAITIQKANQQVIWSSDPVQRHRPPKGGEHRKMRESHSGKSGHFSSQQCHSQKDKMSKFPESQQTKTTQHEQQHTAWHSQSVKYYFFFKTKRDTKFKRTTFLGATEASSTRFKLVVHSIVSQRVMANKTPFGTNKFAAYPPFTKWWHGGTLWINKQQHRSREIVHRRHTI